MNNLFTEIIYTALYLQQWNINHTCTTFLCMTDLSDIINSSLKFVYFGSSAMHDIKTTYHKTNMIFVLPMACLSAGDNRYFCDIMPS